MASKDLKGIIERIEEKLKRLEQSRDEVQNKIRVKEIEVAEIRNTIASLQKLESSLG